MKYNSVKLSSIICGLLFLAAGVLLFAFNTGLLEPAYKKIVFSWQMLLVAIGFVCLFSRGKWTGGIVLMLVGGFFILPKLKIEGLEFVSQNVWALVFIIVGVFVICGAIRGKYSFYLCHEWSDSEKLHKKSGWKNHKSPSGQIDRNFVFSGAKEQWDMKNFRGGEINTVFGGAEIDLSEAQLAEGVHHLEINAVFGGIVLYVPIDWNIEIQKTQAFGAFEDKRPKPGFEIDESKTLIIEANAVFGGGEIKCKQ